MNAGQKRGWLDQRPMLLAATIVTATTTTTTTTAAAAAVARKRREENVFSGEGGGGDTNRPPETWMTDHQTAVGIFNDSLLVCFLVRMRNWTHRTVLGWAVFQVVSVSYYGDRPQHSLKGRPDYK